PPVAPARRTAALHLPVICSREGAGCIVVSEQRSPRPLRHLVSSSLGQDRRNEDEDLIFPFRDDLREGGLSLMKAPCGEVSSREVPHDEGDPLTDGRRGGQGPPPPCRWIR